MPPPSPSSRRRPPTSRPRPALLILLAWTVVTLAGCPAGRPWPEVPPPEPVSAAVPPAERPFLVDPLAGYPLVPAPDTAARTREAWRELTRSGDTTTALARTSAILAEDPGFHPARVLAAQADFLAGDLESALSRLRPVVEELPAYTAAQLLRGRAAEGPDRVPEAYAAYRAAADASAAAADRAGILRERALEIVGNRFRDAVERGRLEDAASHIHRLERWAPDADSTLEATRLLAESRGDRRAELAAVERLLERHPERRELLFRRAELELAVGDASAGLQILQRLADRHPGDAEIRERLEQAKFRWRLTLLPAHVQELSGKAELTRADFATLVHWLVPRVRTSRAPAGRIAGDILEHRRREEIARVVNLGLMDVDSTLHTFSPAAPIRRVTALETLLRAVSTLGGPAACLPAPLGGSPSWDAVCAAAARCGLLPEPADCLPGSPLSGGEALELIRHTLQLFSAAG